MTPRAPHAALAQLLKERPHEANCWLHHETTYGGTGEGMNFQPPITFRGASCDCDTPENVAGWLARNGVVVLDAWIASLTNEQLWEIGHGVQQAGGTMMQWPSVLRETLRRVAEAPSGATGT